MDAGNPNVNDSRYFISEIEAEIGYTPSSVTLGSSENQAMNTKSRSRAILQWTINPRDSVIALVHRLSTAPSTLLIGCDGGSCSVGLLLDRFAGVMCARTNGCVGDLLA